MTRTLSVWVGAQIIYLYGTVNGEATTFTLVGDGEWQTVVPRAEDDNYALHLEAYSADGLEGAYDYTLYYGWMPVVTDRTQADVRRVRALKTKGWEGMTEAERTEWAAGLKGAYNAKDLNRVGLNVGFLAEQLAICGYHSTVQPKSDWTMEDLPTEAAMERYLDNVRQLLEICPILPATPALPETMDQLDWRDANAIEKNLVNLKLALDWMRAGFRRSGCFYTGEGSVTLPT